MHYIFILEKLSSPSPPACRRQAALSPLGRGDLGIPVREIVVILDFIVLIVYTFI